MTNIDVCNIALGRIGTGAAKPIQSLDEASEPARVCNRVFASVLQVMLREYLWPWAQVVAPLAPIDEVSQTLVGWSNLYQYPADCLFLRALGDSTLDVNQSPANMRRSEFRVVRSASTESRVIATNYADAWAWYTADVQDVTFTDPHFRDAFAWRLAAEIAVGLEADARLAQWATAQYERAVDLAAVMAGAESGVGRKAVPDNMAVRGLYDGVDRWSRW